MFGIKFRHNLLKSGILNGKTDIHCHLLPGVDDGSPDMEHSLELLDFMQELGFAEVWLTPHVMSGLHNTADKLQGRFQELKAQYRGALKLHLGSEYMMDADFEERLNTDPLRLGKDHLLVETSYMSGPADLDNILLRIWNKGIRPLIAHPERYMYMEDDELWSFHERGYEFQLNLMSLSGYYGGRPKLLAEQLLDEDFYDYVGTDLHHIDRYEDFIRDLKLTRRQLDKLEELLANNANI